MKSYLMDLRLCVLKDCDTEIPTKQLAKKYRVSPAWARRLKQRRRENGETEPGPPEHRPKTWTAHAEPIRQLIQARPDLAQSKRDVKRLRFLDKTWASTTMTRKYGRRPKGRRVVAAVPHGHREDHNVHRLARRGGNGGSLGDRRRRQRRTLRRLRQATFGRSAEAGILL